jgi:hypothetical protein
MVLLFFALTLGPARVKHPPPTIGKPPCTVMYQYPRDQRLP